MNEISFKVTYRIKRTWGQKNDIYLATFGEVALVYIGTVFTIQKPLID